MADLAILIKRENPSGSIITTGGEDSVFWLQASDFSISHDRLPIVSTLPGTDPITLDLGQWKITINIEGTLRLNTSTNEALDIPTGYTGISDLGNSGEAKIAKREHLEEISASTIGGDWHSNDIIIVDYSDGDPTEYVVKISQVKINRSASWEYYNFTLACLGYQR